MSYNIEMCIENIVKSYEEYPMISKLDADELLNKEILVKTAEKIRKVLLPGFFNDNKVRKDYIKYIIGEEIEYIQYNLQKQIAKALGSKEDCNLSFEDKQKEADRIVAEFLDRLPALREYFQTDLIAFYNGDPAAYSTDEIIFSYPGYYAINIFRIAHELFVAGVPMIPRILTEHAHSKTGIDIHPGATVGKYFFIDHGTGIVIGETTTIGDNVKIYQGVTLGALSTRKGQALKGVKRHPTIGNNVTIYSGTSILGGETVIGDDAVIGGNSFIVESIAPGTKVTVKNPELKISGGKPVKSDSNWVI